MGGMPLGMSLLAQPMTQTRAVAGKELLMPATALYSRDGKTYVWKVDEATATVVLVAVAVIGFSDQGVRLQEANHQGGATGLKAGDRIVTAGVNFLREGQKIRWTGA
ncbi:MAG: hypothetical protein EBV49_06910 [Betaproteobacteria bacterium]|nr:hypothetical protein [Betaproteobacteria bacterium]